MSEKFKINLKIAGKAYTLTVERSAEEIYRRAEREVNDLVAMYGRSFKLEQVDYLAMAALQLAVGNIQQQMSRSLGEDVDALAEIDRQLDACLGSEN